MTAFLHDEDGRSDELIPCDSVLTIGRDQNNDLVLQDLLISRHHAIIRRLGNGDYYLADGGSTNGCHINDQRITVPTRLNDDDRIRIGRSCFRFVLCQEKLAPVDKRSLQDTVILDSPEIRQITILVADIRDYTTLSEQVPIRVLTRVMNKWFHDVGHVIQHNAGTVDKFIGDCVFARWEADDARRTVYRALRTAWQIGVVTHRLSGLFPSLPGTLRIGVGINTGQACVGIGVDNTALGDAVNIAFRLESATKRIGTDVLLSSSSYRHLPAQYWRERERLVTVKGRRTPVHVCGFDFQQLDTVLQALKQK